MKLYALLFKGGKNHSELTPEYFGRFREWAAKISAKEIPGQQFKQEGKIVSALGVDSLKFDKATIGGCIAIKAEDVEAAVQIAKGCPILENNGTVEIREIILSNA